METKRIHILTLVTDISKMPLTKKKKKTGFTEEDQSGLS